MVTRIRMFTLLFSVIWLTGCMTQSIHSERHQALSTYKLPAGTSKALLLPIDITVHELHVSGSEEVPAWTAKGTQKVGAAVRNRLARYGKLRIMETDHLDESAQKAIDQHLALYYPVLFTQMMYRNEKAWQHKLSQVDSTLGPGLAFLQQQTGASLAIVVSGADYISTSGRKMTSFLAAAFGVVVPMGQSFLNIGIIDLKTGNLLWNNTTLSTSLGFLEDKDVNEALEHLFATFPAFRRAQP